MQQQRTLRDAWISTMTDLGAPGGVDTLLIGPHAEALADDLPGPTGGTAPGVAVLGVGPVPDGATPSATGFDSDLFDAAVVLSAWETPADVGSVVEEAMRVVRPGGTVWLGDIDAKALTASMPAARRYGLFYRSDPDAADAARFRYRTADVLGVDAVRAGLRDVTETKADLPVAVIDSAADGVEAVRSGIWPGTEFLDPISLDGLLERTDESLQPPVRFPIVMTLPWIIVRGQRP
jgi:SAM-dependent methyltransferase